MLFTSSRWLLLLLTLSHSVDVAFENKWVPVPSDRVTQEIEVFRREKLPQRHIRQRPGEVCRGARPDEVALSLALLDANLLLDLGEIELGVAFYFVISLIELFFLLKDLVYNLLQAFFVFEDQVIECVVVPMGHEANELKVIA